MITHNRSPLFPALLLLAFVGVLIWSVIRPENYGNWFAEVAPALIVVIVLVATYRRFRFTGLFYGLLLVSLVLMLIGGHYSYEKVPLFNWIKTTFHLKRNDFDRFGHAFQGAITTFGVKELLIRLRVLQRSKWLTAIALAFTLSVSALYEIDEFAAYKIIGGDADEFLGLQGDMWDAQWDMLSALIGVATGLLYLGKLHDRKITELCEPQTEGKFKEAKP